MSSCLPILLAWTVAFTSAHGEPAHPSPDDGYPYAKAPDGHRGFGDRPDPRALSELFRNAEGADAHFLAGLYDLARDVEVFAALAAARYQRLGYFELLDDLPTAALERDVGTLHRRFLILLRNPFGGPMGEEKAQAFVGLFLDRNFRARIEVLDGYPVDLRELRGALALFTAHSHGRAEFTEGEELSSLARRADLAAGRLRALRLDLDALYESIAAPPPSSDFDPTELAPLFDALRTGDPSGFGILRQLDRELKHEVGRLTASLFTPRFDKEQARALTAREQAGREAERAYREMRLMLPITDEGEAAVGLEDMKTGDRYRQAADAGAEALRYDPLNEGAQYSMGLAVDFFAGRHLSIPRFDRFLALRGIRHWDHRTFAQRHLTVHEEYALYVVADWRPPKGD